MTPFEIAALLVALAALFGAVNHLTLGLPSSIGLLLVALAASAAVIAIDRAVGIGLDEAIRRNLERVDFAGTLLDAMLGFLLFAGALHIDLDRLRRRGWTVALIATLGVVLSVALIAAGFRWLSGMPWAICLVMGTILTPTDPVAVLGLLRDVRVPRALETKIAGESLFNDGVAYVLFLIAVAVAFPAESTLAGVGAEGLTLSRGALLFVQEAVGGAALGLGLGWATFRLMRRIDDYALEVLLTLALVMGGYVLALALHLSGPLAMVCAGLLIGHVGMEHGMTAETRRHVDAFWRIVDEVLNAVLFLLIGLEVFALDLSRAVSVGQAALLALGAIPLALAARFFAVGAAVMAMRPFRAFAPGAVPILAWGGLRGGISVALALSLPPFAEKATLLGVTYAVVIFSIVVQGLTIAPLVRALGHGEGEGTTAPPGTRS